MSQPLRKIIWAIDASQEGDRIWKLSTKVIRALTKGTEIQVKPVYVLMPHELNVPGKIMLPQLDLLHNEAQARIVRKLKGIGFFILNLMKPEIITRPVYSSRGAAKALHDYAVEAKADLIVLGTHGRTGVPRLFLGSFAESLLLQSSIPLLVVGASSWELKKIDHILFPSDLSESTELVFEQVLSLAEQTRARITISHVVQTPLTLPTPLASTARETRLRQSYVRSEKRKAQVMAEKLSTVAAKRGVTTDILLRSSAAPVSEVILKSARALGATLIAMAAHSGAISSALAGSTTRQVVRAAYCPVWVLHERAVAKTQRQSAA